MKTNNRNFILMLLFCGLTTIFGCDDSDNVTLSGEKDILSFSVTGQTNPATINVSNLTVVVEVECGTNLTSLTPTFTLSQGATASPSSGTAADYSNQVTITVTAEDGTSSGWKVTISEACTNATDILTFSFPEETGAADIDNENHTIDIEVENGADLAKLTPEFTLSEGATSSPASGTEGDYSSEVTITVTAEDGTTTQDWMVNVSEAAPVLSTETDILTFSIPEKTGDATINDTDHTIDIEVANGTDLTKLTPVFTLSEGATSSPASGTEGDYSGEVTITVTAEDGTTTQDWKVNVTAASVPSDATDILLFLLAEQTSLATINPTNHTVAIEVVNGTDRTTLTPKFKLSLGATSVPESETAGNYSSEVTITVTAEDGTTTQDWKVNVSEAVAGASDKTDILSFTLPEETRDALIDGDAHRVTVEVATGTNLASLTPTFTLSPGATSVPVSETTGDYTSEVTIAVTAEDGTTTQDWTIEVYAAEDFDARIFCDENLCTDNEELQQECIDYLVNCLETEPDANDDECVIGALLICRQ